MTPDMAALKTVVTFLFIVSTTACGGGASELEGDAQELEVRAQTEGNDSLEPSTDDSDDPEVDDPEDEAAGDTCFLEKSIAEDVQSIFSAQVYKRVYFDGSLMYRYRLEGEYTGVSVDDLRVATSGLFPESYSLRAGTQMCRGDSCVWGYAPAGEFELATGDVLEYEHELSVKPATISGQLLREGQPIADESFWLIKIREAGQPFDWQKFQKTEGNHYEIMVFPGEYEVWAMAGTHQPRDCKDIERYGNGCPPLILADDGSERMLQHVANLTLKPGDELDMDLELSQNLSSQGVLDRFVAHARWDGSDEWGFSFPPGKVVFERDGEFTASQLPERYSPDPGMWNTYFTPLPDLDPAAVPGHEHTVELGELNIDVDTSLELELQGHCLLELETGSGDVRRPEREFMRYLRLVSEDGLAFGFLVKTDSVKTVVPEPGTYQVEFHWPSGEVDPVATIEVP